MHKSHKTQTSTKADDLARLLKEQLKPPVWKTIRAIGSLADEHAFSAYIVGGIVRDMLLGRGDLDLDIVVEGDVFRLIALLQQRYDISVVRHREFGTATITLKNGGKIDLATARRESYGCPAALPKVSFSSIADDLSRRDFTINTLAVKINASGFGRLLDPFAGREDLCRGRIRVLHEQSFRDDPTRILRAVRLEQRFAFQIEKHTLVLMREALKQNMLRRLSKFRIGDELILILKEEDPLKCLMRLRRLSGGLEFIHPQVKLDRSTAIQFKNAHKAIHEWKRHYRRDADSWLVYFMILTYLLGLEQLKRLCRDFSLTKGMQKKILSFKKEAASAINSLNADKPLAASRIYSILSPFCDQALLALLAMSKNARTKRRISLFMKKFSQRQLVLRGADLKRLGLPPGPAYRDILEKALLAKVDGKVKTKKDELKFVKSLWDEKQR